ncbi:MAG: right-handed parallel beta-helix repeat-containing protein, partial [Deltaproteobacteria bacterium]
MNTPVRVRVLATLVCGALLLLGTAATAQTVIPGGGLGTQTWTSAAGPYVIQGDVTVLAGATLTIQAGTVIQVATTDATISGADTSRVEFIVNGTLVTSGTAASPVVFQAATAGSGRWVGLRIAGTATGVNLVGIAVRDALVGLDANGPATVDGAVFAGSSTGVRANTGASLTLRSAVTVNNSNGIVADNTLAGTAPTLTVANCTAHANGSTGIYVNAGTVIVIDSIVTRNTSYGIFRNAGTLTLSYSNVWNNGTNLLGAVGGAGMLSANPLYVTDATNLRLTSNSPSRFGAMAGGDQGALAFTGDPTPALVGTLWTDTTLTAAASPYAVPGDLTVAPGHRLTVGPGVTLTLATTDLMLAGTDTARVELQVNGTLVTNGTAASPVVFQAATAGSGRWVGIRVGSTATGVSIAGATVRDALVGVDGYGPATLDADLFTGNSTGVRANSGGRLTVTNLLVFTNSNGLVTDNTLAGTAPILTVTNCTVHANASTGVYVNAGTVTVANSIVTRNTSYGLFRNAGTLTVTYSDVWNNGTNYLGVVAGAGCISTSPLFVSDPTDLHLGGTSLCIDAGSNAVAPTTDYAGTGRPVDGDGVGGAVADMGAYEFYSMAVCG